MSNGLLIGNKSNIRDGIPVIEAGGIGGGFITDSAASGSSLAFLVGELEKRNPRLLEPLTSTTWPRDIKVNMGGGWVERVSGYTVGYGDVGGGADGLARGQTTEVPVIQIDTGKDWWDVFTFMRKLHVPLVDQAMLRTAGRSLDEMMTKGLHLSWDKQIDENTYVGFEELGTYGLVNNPNIMTSLVATGASGSTSWDTKTPIEILADIDAVMNDTWERSEYDLAGMANHILLPPRKYSLLVQRIVSEAGNQSLLNYLLENNIGRNQGIDLGIYPSRWCMEAGTGGTDRMVAYANNEDTVEFDMTVPLARKMTQVSAESVAYISVYAGQFSQVKFKRLQPAAYRDGV